FLKLVIGATLYKKLYGFFLGTYHYVLTLVLGLVSVSVYRRVIREQRIQEKMKGIRAPLLMESPVRSLDSYMTDFIGDTEAQLHNLNGLIEIHLDLFKGTFFYLIAIQIEGVGYTSKGVVQRAIELSEAFR
ncbi:hypothetical protein ACJX0J_025644, partial [Zea mays]